MAHHIIYVPGIGDERALGQDWAISWWRLLGVRPHYYPVGWSGNESFQTKLDKLLQEIDSYVADGDQVSLLGFSAGASAVLNAFAERRQSITAVICVSGKINHPRTASNYFVGNSAFEQSLHQLQPNLQSFTPNDKQRIVTLYPRIDTVISEKDARIPGVENWRTIGFNHVSSIAVALTVYAPRIVRHAKKLAKESK